jgi:hypothetical protein
MNEVTIMKCLQTEDKAPSVSRCFTVPVQSLRETSSNFIADTTFDPSGTRIITITDQGFWSVCGLQERMGDADLLASGGIVLPSLPEEEVRTGWWKLEWSESETLFVAESKGLYRLNVEVKSVRCMELTVDR